MLVVGFQLAEEHGFNLLSPSRPGSGYCSIPASARTESRAPNQLPRTDCDSPFFYVQHPTPDRCLVTFQEVKQQVPQRFGLLFLHHVAALGHNMPHDVVGDAPQLVN